MISERYKDKTIVVQICNQNGSVIYTDTLSEVDKLEVRDGGTLIVSHTDCNGESRLTGYNPLRWKEFELS